MKPLMWFLVGLLYWPISAMAGQTIVARETESYFFENGKMEKSQGQFENTYYLEDRKSVV